MLKILIIRRCIMLFEIWEAWGVWAEWAEWEDSRIYFKIYSDFLEPNLKKDRMVLTKSSQE